MKTIIQIISLYALAYACILVLGCSDNSVIPPPVELRILSVTPSELALGAQLISVEIDGSGFSNGVSVDFGEGVQIVSIEVRDSQHIDAVLSVSPRTAPGTRTVSVSGSGTSAQLPNGVTVKKNPAPSVIFTITPDPGSINTVLQLDASLSSDNGSIASYKWEFDDGGKRNGVKAKYQFTQAGEHTVRLTLTDNKGGISVGEKTLEILDNLPPVASFTVSPSAGSQLTFFTFDASSSYDADGSVTSYHWDFADGTTSNKVVVKHQFSTAGKFRVELTVKDNQKAETTDKKTFNVKVFDVNEAIQEINAVTKDFLRRFGDIETLSAEEIVVGFSTNPACPGRSHEINIIDGEKPLIENSAVQILGDAIVTDVTETKAHADLTARFYGTHTDGSSYDGVITHHFEMVNEGGEWKICDFTLN